MKKVSVQKLNQGKEGHPSRSYNACKTAMRCACLEFGNRAFEGVTSSSWWRRRNPTSQQEQDSQHTMCIILSVPTSPSLSFVTVTSVSMCLLVYHVETLVFKIVYNGYGGWEMENACMHKYSLWLWFIFINDKHTLPSASNCKMRCLSVQYLF